MTCYTAIASRLFVFAIRIKTLEVSEHLQGDKTVRSPYLRLGEKLGIAC
ncbi:hypothetical protein [Pseudanabaena sp. 'Roaring Creek']|nr:hypothetical protein [Pseudanabaena sp. 'Roaring Creek']